MVSVSQVALMIEEAIQAVPGSVDDSIRLGNLDGWDSMGLVIFIELVKEKAGAELSVHGLRACGSCADVQQLILAADSN
ncbi:MAG: hypothetical protein ABGY71_11345 [bacterium]|jgi:acyl carrier protein|nr:hypothetical protein [Planctomycetota bacterium]HIL52301.1 hypothetical protein [Planctomycetota bacterium]